MLAVTGHRPDKLGGYSPEADRKLRAFARELLPLLLSALEERVVITGMALGWDQAIAQACVELKIPFIAAVPFPEQADRWPEPSRVRWAGLCHQAFEIHTVCGSYSGANLQTRNEWMVDRCGYLAALWSSAPGGTANCVRYANRLARPVINVWPHWQAFLRGAALPSPPLAAEFRAAALADRPAITL